MKTLWNTTYSDMAVIRRWRGFLHKLGLTTARSWDADDEAWVLSDEL